MLDDNAYGLSRRRVTVSTSGVVPMMDRLREDCPVALAVSLHAPERRAARPAGADQPQVPARELLALPALPGSRAARLHHVRVRDARRRQRSRRARARAVELARDVPCKFNLIPFNPFPSRA
jgi:23S rRNA (adenine2503-C2)-methyltransferase